MSGSVARDDTPVYKLQGSFYIFKWIISPSWRIFPVCVGVNVQGITDIPLCQVRRMDKFMDG